MRSFGRVGAPVAVCAALFFCAGAVLHSGGLADGAAARGNVGKTAPLTEIVSTFATTANTSTASNTSPVAETSTTPSAKDDAQALRLNTLGVAYMNQQRAADAQKLFEKALGADANFAVARVNLGIALLAQQKPEKARTELEAGTAKRPEDPYAWYNLGLVYKDLSEQEKGIAAFQQVTRIAPNEADAYYFEGYLYTQLQKYAEAEAAFRKGLEIFPYHASSEFGLARALQRSGDVTGAKEHLAKFQKITSEHLGAPFGAGYGDQGRFSYAEFAKGEGQTAPAGIAVHYSSENIADAIAGNAKSQVPPALGACFFDFDGDGKIDLFLTAGSPDMHSTLLHNRGGGRFEDATASSGIDEKDGRSGMSCAAGDYDNDGKTDLAVCYLDGIRLYHNEGSGKFKDVTEAVGLRREPGCVGPTFVDYDHDGDLDLYITMAPGGTLDTSAQKGAHNVLWRNNGNSTFTDVSAETALGVTATNGGVVTTDFNNDRAIDFVIPGGEKGAAIYLNPREGKFTALDAIDFRKENLPAAIGVVALDFDKDGWMDLAFTHAGAPGISLWRNVGGKRMERVPLPDFGWKAGWGIAALDYDNDGWVDLAAVGQSTNGGGGEVRLLRNLGAKGWADATKDVQLDAVKLANPRSLIVADVSGNGSADLLVTQLGGSPLLLRNHGGNANGWMRIDLKALNDNKSAIGTKVELYAGALYQKWEVAGASGYLGQSSGSILAGLGAEKNAEVVRLLWPTGVPQDEVNLTAQRAQTIAELDRRGSSCPVLFSWNGKEYEFIADMIGPGVVGHWVAPGERDVPDPTEYLKVSARSVRPQKNGLLTFRFMEPMEETVYLDQVRLLAIDHPATYDVFPNERFASNPPFPEFRVIASQKARPPAGAWDDHGTDVLDLVSKHDRRYVTSFEELPYAGFAKLHWLELDLGEWDATKPLRLLLDGYTDYFTATSMYAADQAGIKVIAPYVEAQNAQDEWVRVVEDMGFPAGLSRTMVADLTGKLSPGTRRIRIVNNLKIYWDQVQIDQAADPTDARVSEVPLADASLAFLGFPREQRLTPASDTVYSYSARSMTGPYARAAGNYTRYGNVRALLTDSDDRFAIFSSGEGVKLDFDPRKLPALPAGWVRDYFFYADGFEKDLDFYAADGFTVEPLPKHSLKSYPYAEDDAYPGDAGHMQYQLDYNTRQRSGRMPATLRYEYTAPAANPEGADPPSSKDTKPGEALPR